jgi:hypothetical protein
MEVKATMLSSPPVLCLSGRLKAFVFASAFYSDTLTPDALSQAAGIDRDQSTSGPVFFGVLPFKRESEGSLRSMKPVPTENPASANYRAASGVKSGRYEGAIAFSRMEVQRRNFHTTILGCYGETPEELGREGTVL